MDSNESTYKYLVGWARDIWDVSKFVVSILSFGVAANGFLWAVGLTTIKCIDFDFSKRPKD